MRSIWKGYVSLAREIIGLQNDASYLAPQAPLWMLILVCALIGWLRNALSIALGAPRGFYSFEPDIMWSVIVFPLHLFLFPSALLHWFLGVLGRKDIEADAIFGMGFHLQIVHVLVPFVDTLGFALGLPDHYVIGTQHIATEWYTNLLYFSPGIIVGWWITGWVVARVLIKRFKVRWTVLAGASLPSYLIILIPIYFVFPTINTLFSRAFGPYLWNPLDYLFVYPKWFPLWGYCTYFVITAVLGLVYWVRHSRIGSLRSLFQVDTAGRAYAWLLSFAVARTILDFVWVPMLNDPERRILVLFNYTIYLLTLYLLIPALAGYALQRGFSETADGSAVLKDSVLIWIVYPAVTVISLIFRSPASQTIEWFRFIPTFMVDNNFLPAGMLAVIPILLVFYSWLLVRHSGAGWWKALAAVLLSLLVVYLLYYQYALRLFLLADRYIGPLFSAGIFTLTFLIPLIPLARRFHEAFGAHPLALPRLIQASMLACLVLMVAGLIPVLAPR